MVLASHGLEGSPNLAPGHRPANPFASGAKAPVETEALPVHRITVSGFTTERRKWARLVRRFKTTNCCRKATISSPKS